MALKLSNRLRFSLFSVWLFSTALHAVPAHDEIYGIVDAYPRGQVELFEEKQVVDYPIALGQIRKIRGVWSPEKERRLGGDLLRRTVQIPDGHSAQEVFDYYHKRLVNNNARALYVCETRNCGASNSWANEVFHVKQLYGLDGDQYYGAYEIEDAVGRLNYIVVYTVARGNQRVFAHLELLSTSASAKDSVAPDAKTIISQLADDGFYVVPGLSLVDGQLNILPEHLAAIVNALQIERARKISIVGHVYNQDPLKAQMGGSLVLAQQFSALLIAAGVSEKRLENHGLGSLAPIRISQSNETNGNSKQRFRLELVVTQ